MEKLIFICEKDTARQNLETALGSREGVFDDFEYGMIDLAGHILYRKDPADIAFPEYKKIVGKFSEIGGIPWSYTYFDFDNKALKKGYKNTERINTLKSYVSNGYIPVIASDIDVSGEGDALVWEVLKYINYKGKVYREYHTDESPKEFIKAIRNRKLVTEFDPTYVMANARSVMDYLTMQETRVATVILQNRGYKLPTNVPIGRLQSKILNLIGNQILAIKEFKPSSVYESRYKLGDLVLSNSEVTQFKTKEEWNNELYPLKSKIKEVKQTPGRTIPPKPLMLSSLSGILTDKGMDLDRVLDMADKMYQDHIISYPRTEEVTIKPDQFEDVKTNLNRILELIGLPNTAFTHTDARSTHVSPVGSHGALHPSHVIPESLEALDAKYGKGAGLLYKIIASRSVMMFLEDTEWVKHDYITTDTAIPFKGSIRIITKQGVVDPDNELTNVSTMLPNINEFAEIYSHEVKAKRPQKPKISWVLKELRKENVGTEATRSKTLKDLIGDKDVTKSIQKGDVLSLTSIGKIGYACSKVITLGDTDVTRYVEDLMKQIYKGKISSEQAYDKITEIIKRDTDALKELSIDLDALGIEKGNIRKEISGLWNGERVVYNGISGGYEFSDEENEILLSGGSVSFTQTFNGNSRNVTGRLGKLVYMDKNNEKQEYVGIEIIAQDGVVFGQWLGKQVKFKSSYRGREFSKEEIEDLLMDREIGPFTVEYNGVPYIVKGKLANKTYEGRQYVGFDALEFKAAYLDYIFTNLEISELQSGNEIGPFEAHGKNKNGEYKTYLVKGKLGHFDYNGQKRYGFIPEFLDKDSVSGVWSGENVSYHGKFMDYVFTSEDNEKLLNGEVIGPFETHGKNKQGVDSTFIVKGKLGYSTYQNTKRFGFIPQFESPNSVSGVWNGNEVTFIGKFMDYVFSSAENEKLLNGEEIGPFETHGKNKKGEDATYKVFGKLGYSEYEGRQRFGFLPKFEGSTLIKGLWNGKEVSYFGKFMDYTFSDSENKRLLNGEIIGPFETHKSDNGQTKTFTVSGKLDYSTYQGTKRFGFVPEFNNNNSQKADYVSGVWNGEDKSFKGVFMDYTFTNDDISRLFNGEEIGPFVTHKKTTDGMKSYNVKGKLGYSTFKGRQIFGFLPEFVNDGTGEKEKREGYVYGTWGGADVEYKGSYMDHVFTDEENKRLQAGDQIIFVANDKNGVSQTIIGGLANLKYNGYDYVGFKSGVADKINKYG